MDQQRDSYQCRVRYSRLLLSQIVHTQSIQPWTNDEVKFILSLISSLSHVLDRMTCWRKLFRRPKRSTTTPLTGDWLLSIWTALGLQDNANGDGIFCSHDYSDSLDQLWLHGPRRRFDTLESVSVISPVQDELLKEIYQSVADANKKNIRWRIIAERMGNRTSVECRRRWAIISLTNRTHWLPDEVMPPILIFTHLLFFHTRI